MKLTLAKKLSLSFGLILAIAIGLGGYASSNMREAAREATQFNDQDIPTVTLITHVERDWLKSMFDLRGYAYTFDPAMLAAGQKHIAEVRDHLKAVDTLANAHNLSELNDQASLVRGKVADYVRLTEESVRLMAVLIADKEELNVAARAFMVAAEGLATDQRAKFIQEITSQSTTEKLLERELKSDEVNTIIQHGITIRQIAWKSIAERQTEGFAATKEHFNGIAAAVAKIRPITTDKKNLDQISALEKATQTYATTLDSYRLHAGQQAELLRVRLVAADAILETTESIASKSVKTMLSSSAGTVASLTASSRNLLIGVGVGVAAGIALTVFLTLALTRPIQRCVVAVQRLAQGDLTAQADVKTSDEIGILANAINTCSTNLRQLVGDLKNSATALLGSAQSLTETSHSQAAAAEETTVQAHTVASAGEELSINSRTMSESAAQITQSTTTVAAAMEEMSSSIQEVARNCAQESEIARKADTQARQTRELMGKLDESARQIGKVVDLINRIAEQTNLLALNATIEAASAGEAGRGFAVVANEVKELARQSAAATENIRQQVTLIQDNAGASMRSLDEVAKIIEQVSHISSSIAAAVEEQSATTSEIVGTIHTVSTSTGALSKNVQQTAEGAAEVARNINGVSLAAADTAKSAARISTSATELNALSATLGQLVARFKI